MHGSDLLNYRDWLENSAKSVPGLSILFNRSQLRTGLEVALLSSNTKEVVIPAFSSHLVIIHLDCIRGFVGEIDRQAHKAEVRKGEAAILPAGVNSQWHWQSQKQCSCLHLALDTALVDQIAAYNRDDPAKPVEILPQFLVQDSQIQHIGLALKAELETGGLSGHLFAESLALALAARLLQQFSTSTQLTQDSDEKGLSRQKLSQAIDYINDHLDKNLSLIDVASVVGISSSHFTRLFKQSTGETPYQYVIQCRVERARLLLQQGILTISEVATLVGFYDQSHLTYHFRRILGVTPRSFLQR